MYNEKMQGFSDKSLLAELRAAAPAAFTKQVERLVAEPDLRLHASDLLGLARVHDPTLEPRLIADFPKWGLLALADRRGAGPGEGVERYWPASHAVTFLEVVRKRAAGTRRRSDLANLPAFAWTMGGDQLVPIEQARRALTTWAQASLKLSTRRRASDVRRAVLRYPQVQEQINDGTLQPTDIGKRTIGARAARSLNELAEILAAQTAVGGPDPHSVGRKEWTARHLKALEQITLGAQALPRVSDQVLLASRHRYQKIHADLFQALETNAPAADWMSRVKTEGETACANIVQMIGSSLQESEEGRQFLQTSQEVGRQLAMQAQRLELARAEIKETNERRQERLKARRR